MKLQELIARRPSLELDGSRGLDPKAPEREVDHALERVHAIAEAQRPTVRHRLVRSRIRVE